jgi:hypothetical protein
MMMKQFKFFRGENITSDIILPTIQSVRQSLDVYHNLFRNNIMVSNNFKLYINSKRLETLSGIGRGTLTPSQILYLDWRINHLTLSLND